MASAGVRKGLSSGAGIRTLLCLASKRAISTTSLRLLSTSRSRFGGAGADADQGWSYRSSNPPPSHPVVTGMHFGVMFILYWWFFHNIIYDPGHVLGPGIPDPNEFTDEELGIPPEEED